MRETVFPSPSPHLVRAQDLQLLSRALLPYPAGEFSLPMALWNYYAHTAKIKSNTDICIGGHVYLLAVRLNLKPMPELTPPLANITMITERSLIRANFIKFDNDLKWIYNRDQLVSMANHEWPPLTANLGSYLIVGQPPQPLVLEAAVAPPRPHSRSLRSRLFSRRKEQSSTATDEGGPSTATGDEEAEEDDEEDLRSQVASLHTKFDQVLANQARDSAKLDQVLLNQARQDARNDRIESNLERGLYPMYNFAYRSRMVPPTMETPTWYPPHEEYYNVSLEHGFDRLTLGEDRFGNWVPQQAPMNIDQGYQGGDIGMDHDPSTQDPDDSGFDDFDYVG